MEVDIPTRRRVSSPRSPADERPPTLVTASNRVIDMGTAPLGEVPAWEACGKVLAIERAGYWEFVVRWEASLKSVSVASLTTIVLSQILNTLLLTLSLVTLLARSNSLAANQYKQLAARIGIAGSRV